MLAELLTRPNPLTLEQSARSAALRQIATEHGLGWLSINRYGAICLNSTKVFFADIDCVPSEKNPQKPVTDWDDAAAAIARVATEDGLSLRCYRTRAGVRLLETSRLHVANDPDTLYRMRRLGCDAAYVVLTKRLNNFRVRLTPKPWRVGIDEIIDFTLDGAIERWLAKATHRIAAYVGTVGPEQPIHPDVATVVRLHDSFCDQAGELA